jgi:hypothetical protein
MSHAALVPALVAALAGGVGPMASPALAKVGTVKCCLETSIDDAPPRRACIVLNVRSRVRPRARARQLCRVIGGKPRGAESR